MSELMDLYQEVILDHTRRPRNFGSLENATHRAEGNNPLCGDQVVVSLRIEGDVVWDIRFEGKGCAIATASASMMTELLKGRKAALLGPTFRQFQDLVTGRAIDPPEDLGKLMAFAGVAAFPVRVKCATLAWHTVKAALENRQQPVTTE
jgi:nitrogen fixation NifU-like protein